MRPKPPPPRMKSTHKSSFRTVGIAILALTFIYFTIYQSKSNAPTTSITKNNNNITERKQINGVDIILQKPSSQHPPKGLLFVAHGCSHSHTDFWTNDDNDACHGECLGLPEERAIVRIASQEFGFAVVAISSINRKSKCWSVRDGSRVALVLKELMADNSKNLPLIAFGASSGGNFVGGILPKSMVDVGRPLDGYIAQIAAPDPRRHTMEDGLPVAVYITMNQDKATEKRANEIVQSLQDQKIKGKQIRIPPLHIHDNFFSERIPEVSPKQSRDMVQSLREAEFLHPTTGLLMEDPRISSWRKVLRPHVPPDSDSFRKDESAVSEVMNVAYAKHEMTRDGVREGLDFILEMF